MNENIHAVLSGHWIHSHEEDTANDKVFRPAAYQLPPSRGRFSFELKSDGGLIEHSIGATDRTKTSEGKWHLEDDRQLILSSAQRDSDRIFEIVSVTPEKLVVKK